MIRLLILFIVLCFSSPVFGGGVMFDAGGVDGGGSEPDTVIGNTFVGASPATFGSGDSMIIDIVVPSGGRTISHAYIYAQDSGGGVGAYEMGIYTTGGTQVGSCSTTVALPLLGNQAWTEALFVAPVFLSAGTYRISAHINAGAINYYYDNGYTTWFGAAACGTMAATGSTRGFSMCVSNYNWN